MKIRHLRDYSIGYQLLRYYVSFYYRIFYRRLYIGGRENIPNDVPVIFAPNHQNALMDALAIVCAIKRQPVFLGRSDIFRNPLAGVALRFFRILPVFRMRDGFNTLRENDEIFNEVSRLLQRNGVIGMMPEGNHGDLKRLRQLKKGVLRIAFQAEENAEFNLNLKIVPVGLEFSNYQSFRSDLYINFGKPIDFKHLFALYRENPQIALNQARDHLSKNMRLYMIDVRDENVHSLFLDLWDLTGRKLGEKIKEKKGRLYGHFHVGKALSEALNKAEAENSDIPGKLDSVVAELKSGMKTFGLPLKMLDRKPCSVSFLLMGVVGLITLFPAWLYGLVNNFIPWLIIRKAVKSIKDKQFVSSFKFALGLVLFSLFYMIQTLAAGFIAGWITAALYLVSLPLSGFVAWGYWKWWRRLDLQLKYTVLCKRKKLTEQFALRDSILTQVQEMMRKYPYQS